MYGRYLILHRHGGLYLDLDFVVLHPLGLGSLGAAVVFEPPEFVTNALMAFPPRHGLLQLILNYLGAQTLLCPSTRHDNIASESSYNKDVFSCIGPYLVTNAIKLYTKVSAKQCCLVLFCAK